MRSELKVLLWANGVLVGFILYYVMDLLALAVDDTMAQAFSDAEVAGTAQHNATMAIPKIIHQTYKTTDIPEHWRAGQARCRALHPDYKYVMWTDEMALRFIEEHYAWFLPTFTAYRYPIERADAIRYFVLYHYGGVYIDLDDGCERRLDPLMYAPAFVRKTSPTGISNDVIGAVPHHEFLLKATQSLVHYNKNWFVPYATIMASTGPLFFSIIWQQFKRWNNIDTDKTAVRILQPHHYKGHEDSFFSISKGSSWHLDDAKMIKSLLNHILSCVVAGFILAFIILYSEYLFYCFLTRNSQSQDSTRDSPYADASSDRTVSSAKKFRKDSNCVDLELLRIVSDPDDPTFVDLGKDIP